MIGNPILGTVPPSGFGRAPTSTGYAPGHTADMRSSLTTPAVDMPAPLGWTLTDTAPGSAGLANRVLAMLPPEVTMDPFWRYALAKGLGTGKPNAMLTCGRETGLRS